MILGIVLVGLLIAGVAFVRPTSSEPNKRLPIYFAMVLTPVVILVVTYRGISRQAKKLESITEETTFTFTADGLQSDSLSSKSRTNWERFNKVVETRDHFVFFPQESVFFIAPKSSFESDEDLEEFRKLLRNTVGEKVRLNKE